MKITRTLFITIPISICLLFGLIPCAVSQDAVPAPGIIVCRACTIDHDHIYGTGENANTRIPPPPILRRAPGVIVPHTIQPQFQVTYTGFTSEAQAAFKYAVDIWAAILKSSVTIRIDATYEVMAAGTLGAAGVSKLHNVNDLWFPDALADALAGFDKNPGNPDMSISFNSDINWYFGTDGYTPNNRYDFVTVVLHEIAHGLGFISEAGVEQSWFDTSYIGRLRAGNPPVPGIYDSFVVNGSGTSILTFADPSAALEQQFTSNDLFWDGTDGVSAESGKRPRLYAPSGWVLGSSYSHLSEATYPPGAINSLMTAGIAYAEAIHDPGPITLGMLGDLGWTYNAAPVFTEGDTTTRSIAENIPANRNIGRPVSAKDAEDTTLTYTLSGTDAAAFDIDSTSGQLKTKTALDYETQNSYLVIVTAGDSQQRASTIYVTITVNNVNEAPAFLESAITLDIPEGTAANTNIGSPLFATDPDAGDTLRYTLGGRDASSFTIDTGTGQLETEAALDYETTNTYTVTVTATDTGNLSDTVTVTINVIAVVEIATVNNLPIFNEGNSTTRIVAEHTPSGVTFDSPVFAIDPDGDTLTYTLDGQDALSFTIDAGTGQLETEAALDYETTSTYTVTVTATDTGNLSDTITVTISVVDVISPISARTPEVRDVIVKIVPGVSSADNVTAAHLAAITSINLGEQHIIALKAGDFDDLTALRVLYLNDNALRELPGGIFDDLTALEVLYLNNNALRALPEGIFSELTALTRIHLNVNQLSALPGGLFSGPTGLETLYLSDNALTAVPESIFSGLTSLRSLYLYYNRLTALPETVFSGLTALETLYLSGNALTALPETVFSGLTALETLYLHFNNLSTVPAGVFSGLTSLDNLALSSNNLTSLPAGVFSGLTALRELYLYNNQLSTLPGGIFSDLSALDELSLSNNNLTSLPAGLFSDLTSLDELYLYNNTVDPLPLTVSLEKITEGQFKVVAPAGSPYHLFLPVSVGRNGSISGDATSILIRKGSVESDPFTVTRTPGTAAPVTVDIDSVPTWLPSGHSGYKIVKSDALPLTVISEAPGNLAPTFTEGGSTSREIAEETGSGVNIGIPVSATDPNNDHLTYTLGGTDAAAFRINSSSGQLRTHAKLDYETKNTYEVTITASDGVLMDTIAVTITVTDVPSLISNRTPLVRSTIFAAISGVNSEDDVTAAHLAAITELVLRNRSITALKADDFDGLTGLTRLDLSSNGLSPLPEDIFSGLTALESLNLSANGLTALPEGLFSGLTALEWLNLSLNGLISLPEGLFSDLTALETLYIHQNRLTALPEDIFSGLTKLTTLNLSANDLTALPEGLFSGLTALTTLALEYAGTSPITRLTVSLEKVGAGAFKAVAPTGAPFNLVLPVSANNGTIDGGATSLTIAKGNTESESLTVTRTPGTTAAVTVNIGKLPQPPFQHSGYRLAKSEDLPLELISGTIENTAPTFTESSPATRTVEENTASGVDIGDPVSATDPNNDDLTYTLGGTDAAAFRIDNSSGQLQTYVIFDYETRNTYEVTITVSDGSLTDTITVIVNVSDLLSPVSDRTLQVRNAIINAAGVNSADDVTDAHLAAITSLNLNKKNIGALKVGDFEGLTALHTLELNHNNLRSLPESIFSGLTALEKLDLYHNDLTSLREGIFSGLTDLEWLYLHYNALGSLREGIFSGLTDLERLYLHYNDLTSLPMGIFSGLTALTDLHLYDNDLSALPMGIFSGLTDLEYLNVGDNALGSLPVGIFDGLTALNTLYLDNQMSNRVKTLTSLSDGIFSGLTALTYLNLSGNGLTSLLDGIFSDLTALNKLFLTGNDFTALPAGIFSGLTVLQWVYIHANDVDPLPLTVSLEKVTEGQFKVVAPTGVPSNLVVPVSANNGSISGGATTLTIPKGGVESDPLTVTRTPGTTAPVTVNIGNPLPGLPSGHLGYKLVKSDDLPLEVISETPENVAPTFTESSPATRTVAEHTASGVDIGAPVSATDPNNDDLTYTLGGRDAAAFRIGSSSGQLRTYAALDYETKNTYTVTITVSDGSWSDIITVAVNVSDIPSLIDSRTPQVRDAILAAVPGVSVDDDVTAAHLAAITSLSMQDQGITALKVGDFDGLTALDELFLSSNNLSSLPASIFDGLTALTMLSLANNQLSSLPNGIFSGLTALEYLNLKYNTVIPLPLTVSLEEVGEGQFKAVAPTGAPFEIVLPVSVEGDGTIDGGTTSIMIPKGGVESQSLTVTRTHGTTGAVTVDIGDPLPELPSNHSGYTLVKSEDLPLEVISQAAGTVPTFTESSPTTRVVAENTASGVNIGDPVAATDADNDTLTYTLGGTDATAFDIDDSSGQLLTDAPLDYETKSDYQVTITVSDGILTNIITVFIAVTDVVSPISARTIEVRDAIVRAVPGVSSEEKVTAAHLAAITGLNLNGRNITALKAGDFDGLTALTQLRLDDNNLSELPAGLFDDLTALTTLRLSDNNLRTLPLGLFDDLTALEFLFISNNALDALPASIFNNLTALTTLYLYSNDLSELPEGLFDNLTALTTLHLLENGLTSLPAGLFDDLTALTTLYLHNNALSALPDGIFSGLSALTHLKLQGNTVNPLRLSVSLEKVGAGEFKAVAPTGAPFEIVLPVSANNGSIDGGETSLTISQGERESQSLTVTRTPGTTGIVTVDIGTPLPGLPSNHSGYKWVKSGDLPLEVIDAVVVDSLTVTIAVPSETQTGAFDATITFSETVSGFEQADVSLTGSAASITNWSTNNDNTIYTATITPTESGTVTIGVAAAVATDAAGNPNTEATSQTVTIEIPIPDPATWMPDASLRSAIRSAIGLGTSDTFTQAQLQQITELWASRSGISDLAGLEYATELIKLSLWANDISNLTPLQGLTKLTYLRLARNDISDVSPLSGLTTLTSLGVQQNSIVDVAPLATLVNLTWLRLADNPVTDLSPLATLVNVTDSDVDLPDPDTTAPDVSITVPSGVQNGAFNVTITFTETVSGFTQSDVSLTGSAANITDWSANSDNTVYTATITPSASGTVTISVAANVATDAAGNPNTAATSRTVTVDVDSPRVTIDVPSGVQTDAFSVTITFTESVSGFSQSDLSLAGTASASITGWNPSGSTTYTATITPTTSGTVTVGVAANVATDAAGNPNTAATSKTVSVSIDTDPPGVTVSVPSGVQNGAFNATITFTETVSGFVQSDVSLTGSAASITGWSANNDNTVYTATITPTASGTVTIGVAANVATDAAGNPNTAATSRTVTVAIDSPRVTIDVPSGTQTDAFDVTITFTESVSGFTQSDVSLSGSAASITGWSTNSDNTVYTATITPTASGTVTVGVAANVATDAAGNPNTAATSKTVTVSVDTDPPGVTVSVPSGTQTDAFDVTITFTETVSGFTQSDVSLTGSIASITAWSANNDNTLYTATITPTASGTVTVGVAANVATDAAGNPNTAATSKTVTVSVDTDPPGVTVSVPSGTQTDAFDVTITFTETVSGFVQSEVSLTGSAASITGWSANNDNTVYTATITPTGSGTVTIGVSANVATDAAGNPNTAATSRTVTVDVDRPRVTIDVPSGTQTDAFDATITFTETVSGFVQSDVSLTGSAASITGWSANSDNTVYTATITPTASGAVTISIEANVATDAANNPNTAATSQPVIITLPPKPPTGITPVSDRTETVRDAIVSAAGVSSAADVTETHLAGIRGLLLTGRSITSLKAGDFDGLTALIHIDLSNNQLSSLPEDVFDGLTALAFLYLHENDLSALPEGIFEGLTNLTVIWLYSNTVDPLPLPVSLEKVGEEQFKAVAPTGAPYNIVLPLSVANGSISGGETAVTIPKGSLESETLTVTRTSGITAAVTVDIGTLPALPGPHSGYTLDKSGVLPLEVISAVHAAPALGIANLLDLATLKTLDPETLQAQLDALLVESDGSPKYLQAIALLESLLASMRPDKTRLLANYPNPFNPETWIPYHLASDTDVQISIYDINGGLVRQLDLGHQRAGFYQQRNRAAHWDGKNDVGERVGSGVYFYQLQADNVSFLRKMVILK